ncbi:MAG: response regulator [Deltaproteobacteria bacterium]|nr:response regulator [Deltaproteobacteria bacterium]
MNNVNRTIESFTLKLALSLSIIITILAPSGYLLFSYQHLQSVLDAQAELRADAVSRLVSSNPTKWRFEELRLSEILERNSSDNVLEARRILDSDGETIASNNVTVPAPRISHIHFIYDAGFIVGRIEVSRTLIPMLQVAALLAIASLGLAAAVFSLFRTIPAKAIKKAYQALEESEKKYRLLYETMQEGMALHRVEYDVNGAFESLLIVDVNPACAAMFSGGAESIIGSDSLLIFGEAFKNALPELLHALEHKNTFSLELTLPGSDTIVAIRAFSPVQGMLATFIEDITSRKEHEKEQLKIEKLESLGVLAGGIAHDFNNVLTGIIGNISFAQMFLDAAHKSYRPLTEAEKASARARELVQQLMTFARGGEPVKKIVLLKQLVNETVSLVLSGSNVKANVDIPDSIHAIEADEGQMSQVFHNIIINAVQAMPGSGTVTVTAHNERLDDHNSMSLPRGEYVCLSFSDHGCGIPEEHLKKIFDPYFTTKLAGNGLGLASVHSIVTRHGGHIDVSSVVGKGTTFSIHLPSTGGTSLENQACAAVQTAGDHAGGSVLVMDDEEMIRNMTTKVLEHLGYQAATCENGAEAIARYKAALASGSPYSAVIMDLTIPGGMGGKEAAGKILALDPKACLIVSSGYSNDPIMSDYRSYGFAGAVAKPYKMSEFGQLLSSVLSKRLG